MPLVRRSGSRALVAGGIVLLCTIFGSTFAPVARSQTTASASELRAEADALSSRYFSALERVSALDDDIARSEQQVEEFATRARAARDAARARALVAYTSSGTQLATLVESSDTLETARRAHLINRVNAHDQDVYARLQKASRELRKQQRELRAIREAQADALDDLKSRGAAIETKLAQAQAQEQAAAAAAQAAATPSTVPTPSESPSSSTNAPTTTPTTVPAPSAPPPPPSYSGTPGVSPHHDDPFLRCVRQRESGGNYSVVNPAGPYLGAYQFLQSTWNVTASHAGRSDLVGVPANVASAYDQDEMAWALYQWQGKGPWGGAC
jgi:hypothetical protein